MPVLVTGAAGFIGFHVSRALLDRGESVVGVDNLNDYYDPTLKAARLAELEGRDGFAFCKLDIADQDVLTTAVEGKGVDRVVHLAAQAGVRYSIENPAAYIRSNIDGHFAILELCRGIEGMRHLVYASSSSVYGGNTKQPFSVEDRVDSPISLYAATKKAGELMSHCYSHLYEIPATGLRFFTVYGPWGRPDMAAFIFTRAIIKGEPIRVFNDGDMQRDFTYIDDIAAGVLACLDNPPAKDPAGGPAHKIYNLGNNRAEPLMRMIRLIEEATQRRAEIEYAPMQPGDVRATYADIDASRRDFGFDPRVRIDEGIPRFVDWYKDFHGV
jgi:UDP-glucuronate 4-epimerase